MRELNQDKPWIRKMSKLQSVRSPAGRPVGRFWGGSETFLRFFFWQEYGQLLHASARQNAVSLAYPRPFVPALLGALWGLSWESLGPLVGPVKPSWPHLGLSWPFWAPWAKMLQDSNKTCQDSPTSCPRGAQGSQKGIPKTELFMICLGSVFGSPSGLPFRALLGCLSPQKLQ